VNIYTDFDQCGPIRNAVVTTGSFDGVHIGHKQILQRLKKIAFETAGETVLVTFHPHPRKVLYPDTLGKELLLINSQREKKELLEKAGLDNLVIVEFTLEFSKITSIDFVKDILLNKIHASVIVTGYDHHFGYNREGDTERLRRMGKEYGFAVEEIPEQEVRNEKVSGTRIREALLRGDIPTANTLLDHPYMIMGLCTETGQPAGSGVFSMAFEEENKLLPPDGVYAISILDDENAYQGTCSIRKQGNSSLDALVRFRLPDPGIRLTCNLVTLLFRERTGSNSDIYLP
jgi:riboflavin kinase/FMN adenylyltransferase